MAALDRLEGHPDFYKRERAEVRLADEAAQLYRTCPAWIYFLSTPDMLADSMAWPRVIMPDEAGNVEWTRARNAPSVAEWIDSDMNVEE